MKNKRGWIQIAEASIAVLIVMSAVLILIANRQSADISEDVYEKQTQILNMIVENNVFRQEILDNNRDNIKEEISEMIPNSWDFSINICDIESICANPRPITNYYGKEVYVVERIITATLTIPPNRPKKLKFFVWLK